MILALVPLLLLLGAAPSLILAFPGNDTIVGAIPKKRTSLSFGYSLNTTRFHHKLDTREATDSRPDTSRITDVDFVPIGLGFDTDRRAVVQRCLREPETNGTAVFGWKYANDSQNAYIVAQFASDLNSASASSTLRLEGSVSIQLSSFTANGKARFAQSMISNDLSISYVLSGIFNPAYRKVQMINRKSSVVFVADTVAINPLSTADFDPGNEQSVGRILTGAGKAAFFSSDPAEWKRVCGDSIIQKYDRGGILIVTFKFSFSSKEEKNDFSGEISANIGGALSIGGSLSFSNGFYQSKTKITLDAFQSGGNPSSISAILGPEMISCSPSRIQDCQTLFSSVLTYIGGPVKLGNSVNTPIVYPRQPISEFEKSFYKLENGNYVPDPPMFAIVDYSYKNYREFNILRGRSTGQSVPPSDDAPKIPSSVIAARKSLQTKWDQTLSDLRTLDTLIEMGRTASNQTFFQQITENLNRNVGLIGIPVLSCNQNFNYTENSAAACVQDVANFTSVYYSASLELSSLLSYAGLVEAVEKAKNACPVDLGNIFLSKTITPRQVDGADWEKLMPNLFKRPLAIQDRPNFVEFDNGGVVSVPLVLQASCIWGRVWSRYREEFGDITAVGLPIAQMSARENFDGKTVYGVNLEFRDQAVVGDLKAQSGIYWNGYTQDAMLVTKGCYSAYLSSTETRNLGLPLSDLTAETPSRCDFENGAIYFSESASTATRTPIILYGGLFAKYSMDGDVESNPLGLPLRSVFKYKTSFIAEFQNGFLKLDQGGSADGMITEFPGSFDQWRVSQQDTISTVAIGEWIYQISSLSGTIRGLLDNEYRRLRLTIPGYFGKLWVSHRGNAPNGWQDSQNTLGPPIGFKSVDSDTSIIVGTKGALIVSADPVKPAKDIFEFSGIAFEYWLGEGGLDGPFGPPIAKEGTTIEFFNDRGLFMKSDPNAPMWCMRSVDIRNQTSFCRSVGGISLARADIGYVTRAIDLNEDRGGFANLVSRPSGSVFVGVLSGVPAVMYAGRTESEVANNVRFDLVDSGRRVNLVPGDKLSTIGRDFFKTDVLLTNGVCRKLNTDSTVPVIILGMIADTIRVIPGVCGMIDGKLFRVPLPSNNEWEGLSETGPAETIPDGAMIAESVPWQSNLGNFVGEPFLRKGDVVLRHFVNGNSTELAFVWNDSPLPATLASPQLKKYVIFNTGDATRIGTVLNVYE
ncbi:hypothetical protein BJ742DRAFT_897624 [Cladochytrium replicatum]|nr:hypothetical protein BJ742DRAFT_897624 [Cladochytrium replicatum]